MSRDNPVVPTSILMALGLAGCKFFGPSVCLSIAHTGACLSIAHSGDTDNCDTNDPQDTDCPEDTDSSRDQDVETRTEVTNRVLQRGILPGDVASRLTD